MDLSTINWLAVVAAALSTFAIGGLWYSPVLLGNVWMKENAFTEDQLKQGNMAKIFGGSFVLSFIMAFNLATFLNSPEIGISEGAFYGFLTGFGWVAMAVCVIALFERRSLAYVLIHVGYWVISFTIMGVILGAWK
jgi:hypothetical protein